MGEPERRGLSASAKVGWAVVIAIVAWDLAIGFWFDAFVGRRLPRVAVWFFVLQVGLHAAWFVLAEAASYWRALAVFVAVLLAWWYLHAVQAEFASQLFRVVSAQWGIVVLTLVAMRIFGFRLIHVSSHVAPMQYSLRDLVVFVTLTAVLLGVAVRATQYTEDAERELLLEAGLGGMFAMTTLLPLIAVFTVRNLRLSAGLTVLVLWGIGAALAPWSLEMAAVLLVLATIQAAMFTVIRWQGYQFRRVSNAS